MILKNRSGQTAISALVGAGIALSTIAAVATMVTYAMKAGKSAQGLSEAGLLTDSIRSILSNSDRCKVAFQVAPAGGGAPVAPVLASDGESVSLSSIGTSSGGTFSPYASVGQKFGSISITGMTLKRNDASSMTLSLTASKGDGAIGGSALTIPPLIIGAGFDSTTGAITGCSFGGGGAGSPANHGTITLLTSSSPSPWTVPSTVTSVKVTLIGGGGAGGGACCGLGGAGGGAGAFVQSYLNDLTPGSSISFSVGSGGTGVAATTGPNTGIGGSGGETRFQDLRAGGGGGGKYGFSSTAAQTVDTSAKGSGGAVFNTGTFEQSGEDGSNITWGGIGLLTGFGGSTQYGNGGRPLYGSMVSVSPGLSGTGYGSGGSGAVATGSSNPLAQPGGNGMPGVIILEY